MTQCFPVYLGLGGNIGERDIYLREAIVSLSQHEHINVLDLSSIYETQPVGPVDQAAFLNMVAKIETSLSPEQLLEVTAEVEHHLGRTREIYWGPRTLDIDILMYDHLSLTTDRLEIPHPRMKERLFVLVPLAEISPNLTLPGDEKTMAEWSQDVQGEGVQKWKKTIVYVEGEFELFAN